MYLAEKKCVPCEGETSPLARHEAEILLKQVPAWTISEDVKKLSKSFKFKNFKEALGFANSIGAIAEKEGHHPDLSVSWGKTTVVLATHAIKGLSENDFIMAAKIDSLQ